MRITTATQSLHEINYSESKIFLKTVTWTNSQTLNFHFGEFCLTVQD